MQNKIYAGAEGTDKNFSNVEATGNLSEGQMGSQDISGEGREELRGAAPKAPN